jgi:hypothetical protein
VSRQRVGRGSDTSSARHDGERWCCYVCGQGFLTSDGAPTRCCADGTPARFHGQRGGRRRRRRTPETAWASGRERELGEEESSVVRGRREELGCPFIEDGREMKGWPGCFMAAMNGRRFLPWRVMGRETKRMQ